MKAIIAGAVSFFLSISVFEARAEQAGAIRGSVTLAASGDPLPHAHVLVVELGRVVEADDRGNFVLRPVPAGKYTLTAHLHPLSDERRTVLVQAGADATVDFQMKLAAVHEEVTVTASGKEETALEAFQSILSKESLELAPNATTSLGEALEKETGISKRSFGPGTSRPVVRGFDGDRVAILQDGLPTGTLSSQSGDHGEPFDTSSLERLEVVRGPATLLYGTNAIGGVVNAITGHHEIHPHAHKGVRGSLSGNGGTANAQGGGNGSLEIGLEKWMFFGSGGGVRTGDYKTPLGIVENSHSELKHMSGGAGWYGGRGFFRSSYGIYDGLYGIPPVALEEDEHDHEDGEHDHEEGPVDEKWRRHNFRFTGGMNDLGSFVERFNVGFNYSNWRHQERVLDEDHTRFFNDIFSYRGAFEQRRYGRLSGTFGVQGMYRDYRVTGEEALTPPVQQNAIALFGLEELRFNRVKLQFGGRVETNAYNPSNLKPRRFTGFSGSAGINARLWEGGAWVGSFSHSYRAPAIEELYNIGPHPGNLAYEVGNPALNRERSDGVETSIRHQASRVRGEVSLFYYSLADYVYMARTGEVKEGYLEAFYSQADARYMGAEARLDIALRQSLWLKLGFDSVDAQLKSDGTPLPRIPPVRGRLGLDLLWKGLNVRPELFLANRQQQVYFQETPTAGFVTGGILGTYTFTARKALHSVGVSLFNAGNTLYRNHVSLIKDFAPEMSRGIRVSYTVKFF